MEPINRYERARRYTKDTVILLVTTLSEQYLEKAAEKVSEKLCDTKFVRGFTDFVMDTEISDRKTLAKVFFAEGDTEVFQAVSNYLDGEALSYLTAEIGNHAALKARDVAKVVLKCAQKNDDIPIGVEDAKFILREMADGTEESGIVNLFNGSSKTEKLFKNQALLEKHYGKHGQEIADVLGESNYSMDKYLSDANYIINSGTYVPELNGYVGFMGGKKYGFVGLDRTTGDITNGMYIQFVTSRIDIW